MPQTNQINNKQNGSKRPRIESIPSTPEVPKYDRFFKISLVTGSFKNVSPFLIHKALQAKIGTLAETRKLADGSLLIQVISENQSFIASKLTQLHNFDVITTPHKTLNIIKGIITCHDLANCSDEEILENLSTQGVTEIYRLPPRKDSNQPSNTFILSFNLHQLPTKLFAGWYSLRVRPYIQSPMRCFHCQRFGHTAGKCSQDPICPSCGHAQHPDNPCSSNSPKCVNCNGPHSPRFKGCPQYKQEFEIQKIRATDKVSYFEAKRKYQNLNPTFSISYSSVARGSKPKQCSVSTQCDLGSLQYNFTQHSPPPTIQPPPTLTPLTIPPPHITPINQQSKQPSLPPSKTPTISQNSSTLSHNKPKTDLSTNKQNKTDIKQQSNTKSSNTYRHNADSNKRITTTRPKKTTPNSSRESILELSTSDTSMDIDPILNMNKSSSSSKKSK